MRKRHTAELFVGVFYLRACAAELARCGVGVKCVVPAQPDIQQRDVAVMRGDKLVRNAVRY